MNWQNVAAILPAAKTASLPRSILHALPPIGLGTAGVESLTSYFCRLANSHACTTNDLAQFIVDHVAPGRWATSSGVAGKSRFVWYERSISGVAESALSWSSALAELTGVPQLRCLTLLPLQSVVAPRGLMAQQARWCPHCLDEDLRSGRQPYFRLAWDIGLNKVCARHGGELTARCPHCLCSNVRHAANFVVPGWCTSCDRFLGSPEPEDPPLLEADYQLAGAQAGRIGELLASMSTQCDESAGFMPSLSAVHAALQRFVEEMNGGAAAHFARRIGVRKSTVHYWLTCGTTLSFDALMRVSLHCEVSLAALVQGKLEGWSPPTESRQLRLQLEYPATPGYRERREHDWESVRTIMGKELRAEVPRSVSEIARSLDLDERLLYIHATDLARQLGERYVRHLRESSLSKQLALHAELFDACRDLRARNIGITVEEVGRLVGGERLNSTHNMYTVLSHLACEAANDDGSG